MEIIIYFGRLGYYIKDGQHHYTIDYVNENGTTHRDQISLEFYNKVKSINPQPLSMVTGIFDIDNFNRLTLIDIKI